jgi:uncharacterized membrane protein YqaE (UPF0057 family)
MAKRVAIMIMNIIFPPIAVMMLTGLGTDTLVNSLLFLLAVIPSHVHGFYISWVYFYRKRKVRKGVWPGNKASGIFSERVNNGGATPKEMAKLKEERDYGKIEQKGSRLSRPGVSRQLSNQIDNWDDGFDKEILTTRSSSLNRRSNTLSRPNSGRSGTSMPQQMPQMSRQGSGRSGRSGRSAVRRQDSRPNSRPASLTRRLSNRLEDTVTRRLADREDRRRRRDDDLDSYGDSTEAPPIAMAEVRRWR